MSSRWQINYQICILALIVFFTGTLFGCRTTSDLTLEEASKISTAGEQGFTPPPRSGVTELVQRGYMEGLEGEYCRDEPPESIDLDQVVETIEFFCKQRGYAWGRQVCLADRLFNRGRDAMYSGRYLDAIALIKEALRSHHEGRGDERYRGYLSASYAAIGDFSAARRYMGGGISRGYMSQSGKYQVELNYQMGKAGLEKARGNYRAAEGHYRKALKYSEKGLEMTGHVVFADTKTQFLPDFGEVLFMLGRTVEAEMVLREAVGRPSYKGSPVHRLRALATLGRLYYNMGRYTDAEMIFKATIGSYRLYRLPCWQADLNTAHHGLAKALLAQGRAAEGLEHFEAIRSNMRHLPELFEYRFANDPDWAYALLASGEHGLAEKMLSAALESAKNRYGNGHHRTAEIRGLLAVAQHRLGKTQAARKQLKATLPILLAYNRSADTQDSARVAFNRRLAQVIETYMVILHKGVSNIEAAHQSFSLADAIRGQSVQQAVVASSLRVAAKDRRLSDLVRREQDAGKKITALNTVLINALSQSDGGASRADDLKSKIEKLHQARTVIINEIEKGFPSYAELTRPRPKKLSEIKAVLAPDETLLAYYLGSNHAFVWSVSGKGDPEFAVLPLSTEEIEHRVAAVRNSLLPSGPHIDDLPRFDLGAALQLYQALLEPVQKSWQNSRHLIIVPHAQLGHLPFGLLVTRNWTPTSPQTIPLTGYRKAPWLVRKHSITVLPSAGSLISLRNLPDPDPKRKVYAGFGDPVFNPSQTDLLAAGSQIGSSAAIATRAVRITETASLDENRLTSASLEMLQPLPDTREEVIAIAQTLGADLQQDVFLGEAASESAVKQIDLSDRRVIVFATHGLVPGDLDGLQQPALALSSPQATGDEENDGLLTMGEIMGLRLKADWVVLSACNTASGQGAGSEAVSGLGQAFFYAGSRALLVSNWPVESASARMLTTELFKQQEADPTLSRAVALQRSMLKLLDEGVYHDPATSEPVFAYAHPVFWAPFALVGEGGKQ